MNWLATHALGLVWTFGTLGFIGYVIHKAKARGRRKFRDEPTARIKALRPNYIADHTQDAL